jgi:hypothetical protein
VPADSRVGGGKIRQSKKPGSLPIYFLHGINSTRGETEVAVTVVMEGVVVEPILMTEKSAIFFPYTDTNTNKLCLLYLTHIFDYIAVPGVYGILFC